MGKITVVKNDALPKFIYALSSLPNPPIETVKRIEKNVCTNSYWMVNLKKLREIYSRWDMKTEV